MVDWELIRQKNKTKTNKDNTCKNKHRIEYDYKVRDDVMLTKYTAYKYETPYKGPFAMTRCFTNVTVSLKIVTTEIRYNIIRIKPYKFDNKVDDFTSKICLIMSAYNIQLFYFV